MEYVRVEADVRRRPEVVRAFLTDVGLVVNLELGSGHSRTRATAEITAWREPELVAVERRTRTGLYLATVRLARIDVGTRIDLHAEILRGTGLGRVLTPSLGRFGSPMPSALGLACQRSVRALVKHIEAHAAAPYR